MIEFEKLTDDEFEEYTKNFQSEPARNADIKVKISRYLKSIREGLQRNIRTLKKIEDDLNDNNECTDLFDQLTTAARSILNKSDRIYEILADFGIHPSQEELLSRTELSSVIIDFRAYEDTLIIDLPELLPHRPTYDAVKRTMKYYYDIDKWKIMYEAAFRKEFEYGKFQIYGEKVCLIFLHHYDREKKVVPDTDNLETKPIIDIIALYLLRDDSYEYMSHYVDAVEDDRSYTEIIICPLSKLHDYV